MKILVVYFGDVTNRSSSWQFALEMLGSVSDNHQLTLMDVSFLRRSEDAVLPWSVIDAQIGKVFFYLKKAFKRFAHPLERLLYRHVFKIPQLKIKSKIDVHDYDGIWIFNPEPFLWQFYLNLLKGYEGKVHISVLDDPITNQSYARYQVDSKSSFLKLMTRANSVDTPTLNLLRYYENEFGLSFKKHFLSFSGLRVIPARKPSLQKKTDYTVAFSGNLFAAETIIAFLKAMDIVAALHKIKISVHIYSNNSTQYIQSLNTEFGLEKYREILKFFPFMGKEELEKTLTKIDFLYLPLSFLNSDELKMAFSFPSKLHMYLQVSAFVILHVPVYAGIKSVTDQSNRFIEINSVEPDEVADIMIRAIQKRTDDVSWHSDDGEMLSMLDYRNRRSELLSVWEV